MAELLPRVKALTALARSYDIGLNIDAEEADRLEISLDLLEALCFAPELDGWNGIGFVIQAYQKRAPFVIDYVIDLARSRHRVMVRLVKGAYWDSEIKRAQVDGLEGYPVYTRKIYTDVAYLACARKLLGAPEAVSAVRHAQRLHAVGHLSAGRPELLPRSVRVPVPARHGRAAVRRSGRPIGAGQAEPPVPHLCAGGHARDAAGLSGAPPAGEWRQHLVREPDRRREHSGRAAGVRSGGRRLARRAAGRAAREDPAAARTLRQPAGRRARQLRRPGPEQRASPGIAVGRAAGQRRHDLARRPHAGRGRPGLGCGARRRSAQPGQSARPGRPRRRGQCRGSRGRAAHRGQCRAHLAIDAGGRARAMPAAPRNCWKSRCRRCWA